MSGGGSTGPAAIRTAPATISRARRPPARRARGPRRAAGRPRPRRRPSPSSSMPTTGSTDWSGCRRPAPSQRAASPTAARVDRADPPGAVGQHLVPHRRGRQRPRVGPDVGIAALGLHPALGRLQGRARGQGLGGAPGPLPLRRDAAASARSAASAHRELAQVGRPAAAQHLAGLAHLEGVAHAPPERLGHRAHGPAHPPAPRLGERRHQLGGGARLVLGRGRTPPRPPSRRARSRRLRPRSSCSWPRPR